MVEGKYVVMKVSKTRKKVENSGKSDNIDMGLNLNM